MGSVANSFWSEVTMFSQVLQPKWLVPLRTGGRWASTLQDKTFGVIGLGQVGSAVTKNLLKSNYKVTTILDVDKAKCSGYPCKVASSPRQLTEEVDITITALPMPPLIMSRLKPSTIWRGTKGLGAWRPPSRAA